ncbi:MAG: hypothetical protein LBR29_01060 [Methylobacteriaceae bacterium]|jgi:protein ImuA|nr:hypothetical protein [Methylobacteriaceae bacterium]
MRALPERLRVALATLAPGTVFTGADWNVPVVRSHMRNNVSPDTPPGTGSCPGMPVIPFGLASLDKALAGGLRRGALHEFFAAEPVFAGLACGMALPFAARAMTAGRRGVLIIQTALGRLEFGRFYGPGLKEAGLALADVLLLPVARPRELLWAMEEALRSGAPAAVIGDWPVAVSPDFTVTRRLALAARESGTTAFLVGSGRFCGAGAAATRWQVGAARQERQEAFAPPETESVELTLVKNRFGPCGRWQVEWSCDEQWFVSGKALPFDLAETPGERPAGTADVRPFPRGKTVVAAGAGGEKPEGMAGFGRERRGGGLAS